MALRTFCVAVAACALWTAAITEAQEDNPRSSQLAWPEVTCECRPWAYHWWLGSAVDKVNLTRELQRYHDAGMGGVHVIPIYGAKGYESRYIEYLSPMWMEMLRHTVSEADRLGMGVDMTTGTGWCFGGPNVSEQHANASVVLKTYQVRAGEAITVRVDPRDTQALVAFSDDGRSVEITDRIAEDGAVQWKPPDGNWQVYSVSQRPSGRMVKRAAPGGAGHMLNLFYPEGIQHYLVRFSKAFADYEGVKPRAMYHDSYEYRSDWSPDLFDQFEKQRGYRLQTELPAFFGKGDKDRVARVKCDYRETVSDVMIEHFMPTWVGWSHGLGSLTRNQAHGSPGNLLDLYAAADIPETEMFRLDRDPLVSKFASSAAHVAGKKLVAAETGTWLAEHFTETLADMKRLVDELFVSGVNHVIYHGTCYSPDEAPWPGWLFYASTEMNPRNSIWRDVSALNAYIARCQSVLQSGRPDNDVLVYWPIHDVWHSPQGTVQPMTVHRTDWLHKQAVGRVARHLWSRGFTFDYVSDRQLAHLEAKDGLIAVSDPQYRAVVVPECRPIPLATMEKLLGLAEAGGVIIFEEQLPRDVPGWGNLQQRRAALNKLLARVEIDTDHPRKLKGTQYGSGQIMAGNIEAGLNQAGVRREKMVDHAGMLFIRRSEEFGRHYFIANHGEAPMDGWVPLATKLTSAAIMDPMTGHAGMASTAHDDERASVYLQLEPGQSIVLRTFEDRVVSGPVWSYFAATGDPIRIRGTWQVEFIEGGPEMPAAYQTEELQSWTKRDDPEAQRFAGAARYSITFDAPAAGKHFLLNLGKVCQSARVRLNGRNLGTLFTRPFRVLVDKLKPQRNVLEIKVTNVSANRIRDLDRRGVPWKNFHDINFVNVDYKPFDASDWPLHDSGLIGPVTLQPVKAKQPDMPTRWRTNSPAAKVN
jgi:hypothetical protein